MNQPQIPQIPLSDVTRYIFAPRFLSQRHAVDAAGLRHLVQLLFACLFIMLILSGLVGVIISSVLGSVPDNVNQTLGQSDPRMLLLMGILIAPVIEELMFRSWLGGPRAAILGLPILAAALAVLATVGVDLLPSVSFGLAIVLALLILAVARQYASQTTERQSIARRHLFPYAFYGSAILFALLHLSNYEGGLSSPIMLLAVFPQAIVGLLLGYVRMRFGILAAIVFHAVYNSFLIGLFLVAQTLAAPIDAAPTDTAETATAETAQNLPTTLLALVAGGLPA